MESFNKVLYFILGLVVVLVFIIVFTGRLNLGKTFRPLAGSTPTPTPKAKEQKGFFSFFGSGKVTPTPTPRSGLTPTPTASQITTMPQDNTVRSYQQPEQSQTGMQQSPKRSSMTNVQTIPATGSPVEILYLAIPTLLSGFALRRKK